MDYKYGVGFMRYPHVIFENINMANEYIEQYLSNYPTGITCAFGDIEIYRRLSFPLSRYGVTHTGIVFNWRCIASDRVYEVMPVQYTKYTRYGSLTTVGVTTDYNTREVIERGKLVLYAFYPHLVPMESVFHVDGVTENDHMCNLEWSEHYDIYD